MSFHVSVDRDQCIGCGACTQICENFKLEDDKAEAVEHSVEELGCNQDAADACPVSAISVTED